MSSGLYFVYVYVPDDGEGIGTSPPSIATGIVQGCRKMSETLDGKMNDGDRKSVTKEFFVFHCLKEHGRIGICVAAKDAKLRFSFGLLENVLDELSEGSRLSKKFLEKKLKFYNNPGNDQIEKCRTKIDDIQEVMVKNLDKMFENLAKTEDLMEDAKELEQSGLKFNRSAKKLEFAACIRCCLILFIVIQIICGIICVIFFAIVVFFAVSTGSLIVAAVSSAGGVGLNKKDGPTLVDKCKDVGSACKK